MDFITLVLLGIITLFTLVLILRSITSLPLCALCTAVSITWGVLVVLLYTGHTTDPTLIGILMGGSIVGLVYFLQQKIHSNYKIFTFPLFLTLISFTYTLIEKTIATNTLIILSLIWILMIGIHVFQNNTYLNTIGKKIVACCKNW